MAAAVPSPGLLVCAWDVDLKLSMERRIELPWEGCPFGERREAAGGARGDGRQVGRGDGVEGDEEVETRESVKGRIFPEALVGVSEEECTEEDAGECVAVVFADEPREASASGGDTCVGVEASEAAAASMEAAARGVAGAGEAAAVSGDSGALWGNWGLLGSSAAAEAAAAIASVVIAALGALGPSEKPSVAEPIAAVGVAGAEFPSTIPTSCS